MSQEPKHAESGVAVVTGAASGIGAGIGRWLAQQGVDVILCDVDKNGVAEVADAIHRSGGGRARDVQADVTDESDVTALAGGVHCAILPYSGNLYL